MIFAFLLRIFSEYYLHDVYIHAALFRSKNSYTLRNIHGNIAPDLEKFGEIYQKCSRQHIAMLTRKYFSVYNPYIHCRRVPKMSTLLGLQPRRRVFFGYRRFVT